MPRPAPQQRRKQSLMPFYILIAVVAVAGAGLLFTQMRKGGASQGAGDAATRPMPVTLPDSALQRVQGIAAGPADAPITIYEFADYGCGHCRTFATFVEPVIKERLVDTGRARYVLYDFPLGSFPHSFVAARAARCANEQGKFWEYHAALYNKQAEWNFERSTPIGMFEQYAQDVGINAEPFNACLRSDKYAREISENRSLGNSLGVSGTPTLFVNGRKVDTPRTYAEFEAELERIAPGAATGTGPTPAAGAGAAPVADTAVQASVPAAPNGQ